MPSLLSFRAWVLPLSTVVLAVPPRPGPARGDDRSRFAALVARLGDEDYARREEAADALKAAGETALPAVRAAAANHPNPEVGARARRLELAILTACGPSTSTGMKLVPVARGEFLMGSPKNEYMRRPDEAQHRVSFSRPFLLGAREVTQDEYRAVTKRNPSWFAPTGAGKDKVRAVDTGSLPVETVTWFDAVEFCNRLSAADGFPPYYELADAKRDGDTITAARVTALGGAGYRLPTEAEWEYGCRAGTSTRFNFGQSATTAAGNFKVIETGGYGSTTERPSLGRPAVVGTYRSNRWGLYDTHGNVAEWCWDWYDKDYPADEVATDPPGPAAGERRVVRGGSWLVADASCRSACRYSLLPADSNNYVGFRVARTP